MFIDEEISPIFKSLSLPLDFLNNFFSKKSFSLSAEESNLYLLINYGINIQLLKIKNQKLVLKYYGRQFK